MGFESAQTFPSLLNISSQTPSKAHFHLPSPQFYLGKDWKRSQHASTTTLTKLCAAIKIHVFKQCPDDSREFHTDGIKTKYCTKKAGNPFDWSRERDHERTFQTHMRQRVF